MLELDIRPFKRVSKLGEDRAVSRWLTGGEASTGDVSPLIRRGTQILLVVIWLLGLLTVVLSSVFLISHARSHSQATSMSLEQFTRQTVGLASFVVDEFGEFLDGRRSLDGISGDAVARNELRSLNNWLPEGSVSLLVLFDGTVALSTTPLPSAAVSLSDRRWFRAHVEDGLDVYIGPAIRSRVNGAYVFSYTAAYRTPDGRNSAIIDLGIPTNSITGLSLNQHSTHMALIQHGGAVVAAQPFKPEMIDKPVTLPGEPPETQATMFGTAFGQYSIISMRNLPDLGLYTLVSVPLVSVLQPLLLGVAVGLPLLVLLTYLLLMLSNQLQKKSLQVAQALADNKMLFQEVHHRVKNNLQVVSSLLRLQTERLPTELRPLLDETGARVRAIALVHEQIYRTASPSDVQLDRFLAQLVQQLSASMIGGPSTIRTELQPVIIGLDRAVPVAILASEAITNAIKHGLAERHGEITVKLTSEDGLNRLVVQDSGSAPPDPGIAGLGTRIMSALARQIDGEWTLAPSASGGTAFTLVWPN